MIPPTDYRLEELFVRYWDGTLGAAETAGLGRRLAADATARERFQLFCLQAMAAADLPPAAVPRPMPAGPAPRRWSRRRVLGYLGGGVAASALAALLGRRFWPAGPAAGVQLTSPTGAVTLRTATGQAVPPAGPVPPGATVLTHGPGSSAVLKYPDGTDIFLTGDSEVTVAGDGRRLFLRLGTAAADIPPQPPEAGPFTLLTPEASLPGLSRVVMTLSRTPRATEVGVQQGRVAVASAGGAALGVVQGGEVLTVGADGNCRKQSIPTPPDEFAWDLTRPLPEGWAVGAREPTADGPVVRPKLWFDPYHQAQMYQIRSDKQWTRGFFRLYPESVLRVRYRVEQPGPGQLVVCVRTARSSRSESGVLECNGAFLESRPREWQWLEVRAGDMLDNIHTPPFGAPWVGFLVIFNTYKEDLGLQVAGFEVARPPAEAP